MNRILQVPAKMQTLKCIFIKARIFYLLYIFLIKRAVIYIAHWQWQTYAVFNFFLITKSCFLLTT